jgi:hypothetical protein
MVTRQHLCHKQGIDWARQTRGVGRSMQERKAMGQTSSQNGSGGREQAF